MLISWVGSHSRSEAKEGSTRPVSRTYYYIDYRATIDAIKFKILAISKKVQGSTVPEDERVEYICRKCKAEYTMLDVVKLQPSADGMGMECERCDTLVDQNPHANVGGHIQSTAWTGQIKHIMESLQKIDTVIIPPNPFETAYASALPVQRSEANPGSETAPVETTLNRPTAVKGLKDTGPKTIGITITENDGPSAADIAAEAEKKKALAAANALPVHFSHSTVTGELVKGSATGDSLSHQPDLSNDAKLKDSIPKSGNDADEISNFFKSLREEQANQAKREAEEEYETDDEDEFEDVIPAGVGGSAAGTPGSSNGRDSPMKGLPALAGVLKRSSGSQSNSGTSTGATSPAGTPEGERAAKRVRIEEPVKVKEEVDSEEEDVEFEDV